jgi:hypothetical protein
MSNNQLTPQAFIAKWKPVTLSERSAAQAHFLDLCDLLGHPKPQEVDPTGEWFTFERGVSLDKGKMGWADVWKRGFFAWEYKRKDKHKDLTDAYRQLLKYREALENPPLLVVSDIGRNEIHTNFTGTAKQVHTFTLAQIGEPENLDILRKLFNDPKTLEPGRTTRAVTEEVARRFAGLADSIWARGIPVHEASRFLMRLMFCMFAEDIDLLPDEVFTKILKNFGRSPRGLAKRLSALFRSMAKGGPFGSDRIPFFNGGLFADPAAVEMTAAEIAELLQINACDWSYVEPAIFGTLFERTLDPDKRAQVGAHYTDKADILALVDPVMMEPLRREWAAVKAHCEGLWGQILQRVEEEKGLSRRRKPSRERKEFEDRLLGFVERLSQVTILDPACGSGNFLYVALNLLLQLEKEVYTYGASRYASILPRVGPTQLAGIEHHPYAQELAQVVVWIGFLQWKHQNGFSPHRKPILDPANTIRLMDAVLDRSDLARPKEPDWPASEFIVGNPPFMGGKKMRSGLGDDYVRSLFQVWEGRVPAEADFCCYWLEKARAQIEAGKCRRAGLLATQGVRGGASREVLKRIKQTGDIFFAQSDRDWILDGANVHVSMVGFDDGKETSRSLDGQTVNQINSDLTTGADVTQARPIAARRGVSYMGDTKGGAFDIPEAFALEMLRSPNPNGKPNSDVVGPWINGLDVTRRNRRMWIIDFGTECAAGQAALYEAPFEHVRKNVYPERQGNKRDAYRLRWWLHVEARSGMRQSLRTLGRFIATTTVSKHRLFVWEMAPTLPDHQLITFAFAEDYHFGLLHSRVHRVWALELGTQLETRPRYTATTCFETFPFPEPTDGQRTVIAEAAATLDRLRNNWLNPREWTREETLEFPGSADGPWARYVEEADQEGIGTARFPRLIPKNEDCERRLAERTLTNLYNDRPAWLDKAHRELDEAVFAAYDWKPDMTDEQILAGLLTLNAASCAQQGQPAMSGEVPVDLPAHGG